MGIKETITRCVVCGKDLATIKFAYANMETGELTCSTTCCFTCTPADSIIPKDMQCEKLLTADIGLRRN